MTLSAIQKAEIDRSAQILSISYIERRIVNNATKPMCVSAAETQIENAKKVKDALLDIQTRIALQQPEPAELVKHEDEYIALIERLDNAITDLKRIIKTQTTAAPTTTSSSRPTRSIKLPEIQLPSFDGNFVDWPSFEDLFKATVENNPHLSPAEKLSYLKGCVKGEASTLIKSFQCTDANYHEAWTLLSTRFNNRREIIYLLVKKLLQQPAVKSDSVTSLQTLLNSTLECVRSLKVLGRPTDSWDDLLVVAVVEKLDSDSKSEWAKTLTGTNPVTFSELVAFLEAHIRSLLARGTLTNKVAPAAGNKYQQQPQPTPTQFKHHARTYHSASSNCSLCKESHPLFQCKKLLEMPHSLRLNAVKKTAACINCLREGHNSKDCTSRNSCRNCKKRHHTLLHSDNEGATGSGHPSADATSHTRTVSTNSSEETTTVNQTLLKTAIVSVIDPFGVKQTCRAFLDDGSEVSYMTERTCSALGLKRSKVDVLIKGIAGCSAARAKWKVTSRIFSRNEDAFVDIEFLVLPQVTAIMPRSHIDISTWTHIRQLPLADPNFNQPSEVDLLIGGDVVSSIMKNGFRHGKKNMPTAQNSIFGWLVSGKIHRNTTVTSTSHSTCQLTEIVQRFWEIEQQPPRKPLTPDEVACEDFYNNTTTRNSDGRYVIRLPFKKEFTVNSIGETRNFALRRHFQLERRFQKYPEHHSGYKSFMQEYLSLGHMELATSPSENAVYIPHHFVLKEDSTTTKLRAVFDASMKSSNNVSLNDMLLVGPTIQDDLFAILLRFRLDVVALKADVAKMYRQFQLHPDDRDFHRIFWRDEKTEPLREYRLTTVTYGTAYASYVATRSLRKLAEDEEARFPEAAEVLKSDMFVDDLMNTQPNTEKAISVAKELISLLSAGGMTIRKWCSNDPAVMEAIPSELREESTEHSFDHDQTVKALGVIWSPQSDAFKFKVTSKSTAKTKRELLSEIAKTFDPLGFLSPVTVNAKILFQTVWQTPLGWDDPLYKNLQDEWVSYQHQLQSIDDIAIPRCIVKSNVQKYEIIGFSDASEQATACAVYLKCTYLDGSVMVNLLTSGTKVAPTKQQSIPRLELCAAVLLVERIELIMKAVRFSYSVTCYTDSMIVLQWLVSQSRRWKTFVATRIAQIQEIVPGQQWHHVFSADNPADLPSRGISVDDLKKSSLWWHGPPWLHQGKVTPDDSTDSCDMTPVKNEEKKDFYATYHSASHTPFIMSWLDNFSTLRKAVTLTSVWLMYFQYLKSKKKQTPTFPISPSTRRQAELALVRCIQEVHFQQDIIQLKKNSEVSANSGLKSLAPYLDTGGILRVGGRLQRANIIEEAKHPALLPKHCQLTKLIIEDCHKKNFHGGNTLVHATIRQKYWIIAAKDAIRHLIRKCVRCRRAKAATMKQLMGQLPTARVTPHQRPFLHAGVDYAGPFNVYMKRARGIRSEKCYFAIFVCFATKAVHLEAVTDLTTGAFIAAYKRFAARRGVCSHLYSDCGTNFVGANNELRRFVIQAEAQFQQQLSHLGTTWVFNPPASPHQGGLWEAGVKAVKTHFTRIVGTSALTLEEFQTLLCSIEACLNSRPLCPLSNDPTDYEALTPGHFLIGGPLTAIPEPDVTLLNENRLDKWQRVQQLSQHFWKRWSLEYLTNLQQRYKWTRKEKNVSIGDLVVIQDENQPPMKWKLGRVTQIHPGQDDLVRTVTLRTVVDLSSNPIRYNEISRPIQKLCPLLSTNEN